MSEKEQLKAQREQMLKMATQVVSAYVSNNALPAAQLRDVIDTVYRTLDGLNHGAPTTEPRLPQRPAVPVRRSVHPDYLICLEDGKKLKMLKRHLRTAYRMTPEEYRMKWGLPADYPMIAPNYAAQRSAFAKEIGLGRRNGERKRVKRASA